MKVFLLTSLITLGFFTVSSQNDSNRFSLSSVSIHVGVNAYNPGYPSSINTTRSINPDFAFFSNDSLSFNQRGNFQESATAFYNFNVQWEKKGKKEKFYNVLNFGFTYLSANPYSQSFENRETFIIDTLISSRTGNETYVDSTRITSYSLNYFQTRIYLNLGYSLRYALDNQWSLIGGVELMGGFITEASNNTFYSQYSTINSESSSNLNYGTEPSDLQFSSERNEGGGTFAATLPLGISYQFSDNNDFWKHIGAEFIFKPSIIYTSVPELGNNTSTGSFTSIGLKYRF